MVRRLPRRVSRVAWRFGTFAVLLLAGGLASATLVRLAPGFGTDERMLDTRLSSGSIQALEAAAKEGSDILPYYWNYLVRLSHGDLGTSVSLGRPVRELIGERMALTVRSLGAGLLLAWSVSVAVVLALELVRRQACEIAAALVAGALLCAPAAVVALACLYAGGAPAAAISAILFPRIFRYLRNLVGAARRAAHVLAAEAAGLHPLRILALYVAWPVLPELLALAGITVSMGVGATIPVETLCDSAGAGQLLWQAAMSRDLPVIVNMTLLITAVTAGASLLADAVRPAREAGV